MNDSPISLPIPADQPAVSAPPPQRVLIVDDSATARVMVEGLLKDAGFETLGMGDGASALAAFEGFRPDLVVLDILMPGMDGLEVCRRIRTLEQGRGVPVLFLTGDERPQTQAQAIIAGGDDLVYKPSLQGQLVIRVRSLLRIRQLQVALEQESATLRALQASQEGLFRFIVHDLKTPLQGVLSGAELVAEDKGLSPESLRLASLIQKAALQMERMVQDILVVCRQGRLTPIPQVFPLGETVQEWVDGLEGLARTMARRRVELINAIPSQVLIEADLELVRRCVLNLLDNAIKYGPPNNEIRIEAQVGEKDCRLTITDHGPGIPEEMRDRIFDPFARLDRDASLARVSSGLGLAFCREVALAHGGRIWVESAAPEGSTFILTLPRKLS
ncbi:MAG TPA: hybrid sensor histidine kinase/response regulator [Holophagaceae bacterium]|nr:hybrid sensor histidine kinase/response regulator [Holophagaceae bacterium]